jgi:GTP-binding protein Era
VFLVINKIDLIAKDRLLPLIQRLQALHKFAETIPISARKKDGLDRLVTTLIENLPHGQRYFPKDQFTDQPERFMVAELIRERILMETGQEIPYASAVSIERFEEPDVHSSSKITRIAAAIYCERPSQKAILIGKGGSKLKNIGTAARSQIEALLGRRVHLDLYVAVEENWRNSEGFLDTQDWRKQFAEMAADQADARKSEADPQASLKHAPRKKPSPKAAVRGKRDAGL